MIWLALAGWPLAVGLALATLALRRRLLLVARAEHELRGPLAALGLAVEGVRRRAGGESAGAIEAQLDRAQAGLADLVAARTGRTRVVGARRLAIERLVRHAAAGWSPIAARRGRSVRLDWQAGSVTVAADRGRLAQALGNLISNAVEHGRGEVELRGRRVEGAVRIEVRDGGQRSSAALAARSRLGRVRARALWPAPPLPAEHGHGLAIAQGAVEDAGGRLELAAGAGGTTAAMELPIEER